MIHTFDNFSELTYCFKANWNGTARMNKLSNSAHNSARGNRAHDSGRPESIRDLEFAHPLWSWNTQGDTGLLGRQIAKHCIGRITIHATTQHRRARSSGV